MSKHILLSDFISCVASQKKNITSEGNNAWLQCDSTLSEPNMVKSFVLDVDHGVDYLNKNVAAKLNASQTRFVLKFAGVFSHQRPYVLRLGKNSTSKPGTNSNEQCELSDIVFLSVCVDSKKNVLAARASFFQAKKEDKIDNLTQRWLYDYDDEFNYKSSSFWEKTAMEKPGRVLPAWDDDRSSAFQYLILPPAHPLPKVRLSPWDVEHSHEFGFFLYRLLTLSAGKNYASCDAKNGAWSSIVNDMLRMAAGTMKGSDRGSPDLDTVVDYFNDFRDHQLYSYDNSPGGVPLVLAIMQDTDQTAS